MFAIDQRVQRWLKSSKRAENSRNKVNNKCLNLDDVIEQVLNRTFTVMLAPAFRKVQIAPFGASFSVVSLTDANIPPFLSQTWEERSSMEQNALDLCGMAAIGDIFSCFGGYP
jgi:hypothetical protein